MSIDAVEVLGYVASALVVLSLTMTSLLRLRAVSLVGSVTFATYAILIGAIPVALTNAAIAGINIFHLRRLWRDRSVRSYFEVVPAHPASAVLRRFIEFHFEDIRRFQPSFSGLRDEHLAWWILRDAVPAGLVLALRRDDGSAHLDLDYVTEPHRDFEPGAILYGPAGPFREHGIERVVSEPGSPAHQRYLARMGFRPEGDLLVREVPD